MIVIYLLIPVSIIIAACFLIAFIWAVRSGQYEDTCTPSMRLLLDEQVKRKPVIPSLPSSDGERPPARSRCETRDLASDSKLKTQ